VRKERNKNGKEKRKKEKLEKKKARTEELNRPEERKNKMMPRSNPGRQLHFLYIFEVSRAELTKKGKRRYARKRDLNSEGLDIDSGLLTRSGT